MRIVWKSFGLLLFVTATCGLAGCGNSNVVPVAGTLTYKGKPVTNAIVHFVPAKGRPSSGNTDANGKFVLTYDPETKGAERGKHRVFIEVDPTNTVGAIPGMPAQLSADQKVLFDKYGGSNSKVEVTVEKATPDLKLEWD